MRLAITIELDPSQPQDLGRLQRALQYLNANFPKELKPGAIGAEATIIFLGQVFGTARIVDVDRLHASQKFSVKP